MDVRRGLTRRMAIASGLLTLVLVAGFMAVFLAITHLHDSTQSRRHIREELVAANAFETLVIDLEAGLRGFVIAPDDGFLGPWTEARARFPGRAHELEVLVAGEPAQLARVRRIVERVRSYVRDYSLPLVNAVRRREGAGRSVRETAEGSGRIDAIRAELRALLEAAGRTLVVRERSADRAERLAVAGAGVGAAGSILLVCSSPVSSRGCSSGRFGGRP